MEMPKNCMLCPFCVEEADPANGEMCMVTGKLMPPCNRERLDDCPLIHVPPHGDLIDRREAERYALPRTEMVDGEIVQNKYVYLQTIQQLPTIIPAEEG
jgi:hypothetical protein